MARNVPREIIQKRCVDPIKRLKARGVNTATSDDIVAEMLCVNYRLFSTWFGDGRVTARNGIAKSIGDALGDAEGGLFLPYHGNPKIFELDKIAIVDGKLVRDDQGAWTTS